MDNLPKLTPEEEALIQYHRNHLYGGTALKNADGSYTTFRGAVVGTDNGHTIMPTYWNGAVRPIEESFRNMVKSGISFPNYPTVDAALAAEQRLHGIMESDVAEYSKNKKPE